jgi:uncharacterized protein
MVEPTQDERTMAALGHGLTFVEGGILGPFVLYLLQKDKSQFAAFHCLQSLYFGLLMAFLALFVGMPIYLMTCGFGVIFLFPVVGAYLIFEVIAGLKAYDGEWYKLPIVGDYAYESHNPDRALAMRNAAAQNMGPSNPPPPTPPAP